MGEISQKTARLLYDACVTALNVFSHLYAKMGEEAYNRITKKLQDACERVRDDERREES